MKTGNRNARKALRASVSGRAKKMPVVDTDGRFKTKNKKHEAKITKKRNKEIFKMSKLFIEL